MDPAPSSTTFVCAKNPQRVRPSERGLGVRVAVDPRSSVVSVDDGHVTIQHVKSGDVVAYRLDELRAVVDLTRDGARHLGVEGPHPLRREPVIGHLVRGTPDTVMTIFPSTERLSTIAFVFASPSSGPSRMTRASEPGVTTEHGLWQIDALYLDVVDVEGLLGALKAGGVPIAASVGDVLASTIGAIDDPGGAAALSAARRTRRVRFGWLTMSPVLALFVGFPAVAGLVLLAKGEWWWTPVLLVVAGFFLRNFWGRIHHADDST